MFCGQLNSDMSIYSIWAAWKNTSQLDVARRAVRRFAEDLTWVTLRDAPEMAARFASTISDFPELLTEVDPGEIAARIRQFGVNEGELYFAFIAQTLAPSDCSARSALLQTLSRVGSYELLAQLLQDSSGLKLDNLSITRLLDEVGAARVTVKNRVRILRAIADLLSSPASLAKQKFGAVLARAFVADETRLSEVDELIFAQIAVDARKRSKCWLRKNANGRSCSRRKIPEELYTSARQRVAAFHRQNLNGKQVKSSRAVRKQVSGIINWFDFQLTLGAASVDGKLLKSAYGQHHPDGSVSAVMHPPNSMFLFGPYISLSAGSYMIRYIGRVEEGLAFAAKVTCNLGQTVIAATDVEVQTGLSRSGPICCLSFKLDETKCGVEFTLIVKGGHGELAVERIDLEFCA